MTKYKFFSLKMEKFRLTPKMEKFRLKVATAAPIGNAGEKFFEI